MRKFILALIVSLSLFAFALNAGAWSDRYMQQTATKTADAACMSVAGYFYGVMVITDGTNSVAVDIYDNTSGSGTKLIPTWTVTTSAASRAATLSMEPPIACNTGIYVDITTAGTVSYIVYYREQ